MILVIVMRITAENAVVITQGGQNEKRIRKYKTHARWTNLQALGFVFMARVLILQERVS